MWKRVWAHAEVLVWAFSRKCVCVHALWHQRGQRPWVLPCAQNHLTQADASLKHCHTRWPAERPGKYLIVAHISIFFAPFFWNAPKFHKDTEMQKGWSIQEGPFLFHFHIFPTTFQRSRVSFDKCVWFWRGATWRWACRSACVCMCVWERDSVYPSHGNPALLIKSARAARVWGRRWPHSAHTHSQTNTHTHRDSGANTGPTSGLWCTARGYMWTDLTFFCCCCCWGTHQQMAEAQPPFSFALSHFLLFLFPAALKCLLPPSVHPFFHSNSSFPFCLARHMEQLASVGQIHTRVTQSLTLT